MREPVETYRGIVYPWHCDHMGHMNVMWYTGKFDEATWNLFGALGLTPTYMREQGRGMVALEQNIVYKRELMAGDLVLVRSQVLEVRPKVLRFRHEMFRSEADELAATSEMVGAHFDRSARRAVALPEDVASRAREMIVQPG